MVRRQPISETHIEQLANQLPNCQIYSRDPTDQSIAPIVETTVIIAGEKYSIADTTELFISDTMLSNDDLVNIGKLTNLTSLNLASNQISDITPLAQLTNLTRLYLWWNQITDITPLAQLTNLTDLGLGHNQIADIAPLAKLTNLTLLDFNDNPISEQDIEDLRSKLPNCEIVNY